ncbi:MAG: dehydrogenase, partial [Flavobacteriaceae bacterium]|nr:dehydrogenase [Eudoraea sp.]NNJ38576.1 dehydrogenase [Flavobacteriaceae bacterium]
AGVHWALEVLENQPEISADLLDLRTLQPLDMEAVYASVRKTGKLLVLQEDTLFGGVGSDIAALVGEHCFEFLDAPVKRVGSLEMPVPFAKTLEKEYLPKERFVGVLRALLEY